jgi:TatA/E family protein of Tat protein translocase
MGIVELLAVLFVVLLFFGGSRLPALGAGLGKALRNLKGAVHGDGLSGSGSKPSPRELPPGGEGGTGGEGR